MARYNFLKTVQALTVGVLGAIAFGGGSALAEPFHQEIAQNIIIPDGTTNSRVESSNPNIAEIRGGFVDESNLLHSFQEFNIGEGKSAYFFTDTVNIETIFARVTGSNASAILGTLGTVGNSTLDLWLINPNGILFGPNSRLEVAGSFVATTANAIRREDIGLLPASEVSDSTDLLTISDSVFIFNRDNVDAEIINQSQSPVLSPAISFSGFEDFKGLQVAPGQSLGLVSRDIAIDNGGLNTLNGNIFLSALEDIELVNGAAVQAGNIFVETNRLSVQDGSQLLTQLLDPRILENVSYIRNGETSSFSINPDESLQLLSAINGGNIFIVAQESVDINGASLDTQQASQIASGALGALRTGGNITVDTNRFTISNGGRVTSNYISVSDRNEGGGNIALESPEIEISGSFLFPEESEEGSIRDFSGINIGNNVEISPTNGSVAIASEEFSLTDGARIAVSLRDQKFSEITPLIPGFISIDSTAVSIGGTSSTDRSSFLFANRNSSESIPLTTSINTDSDSIVIQSGSAVFGQDVNIVSDSAIVRSNSIIRGEDIVNVNSDSITVQSGSTIRGQNINLTADGTVLIEDDAAVSDTSQGPFPRSEETSIKISAQNLELQESARVNGNEIELSARNSIEIQDRAEVTTADGSLFDSETGSESVSLSASRIVLSDNANISSPNISLDGGIVTLRDQANVSANQQAYGDSGDILVSVVDLNILDSAQLSASIDRPGRGGSIDIAADNTVNLVGDRDSAQPSSIRATSGGPGTGGQISIRTRRLNLQNGSQVVASLNGGGTGGSVDISAEESVNISGSSRNGTTSGIFADSNLDGGEYVVLRSLREGTDSPQFITMRLDTEVILFTQTPGLIRSRPRTGADGSNRIFLDYNPPDDDPRSVANLAAENENVPSNQVILSESVGFGSQETGSARQALFLHLNVPDDGTLILGQSMNPDFSSSIEGGKRIFPNEERLAQLRAAFIETLESIKDVELIELEGIETDPDDFAGNRREGIFSDIDAINTAFVNDSGELYVIESTGEEFRIRDDTYTDTRFTDIQSGDTFLVFAVRDGGDISIETGELMVRDGAEISATSLGSAEGRATASDLNIIADSVFIDRSTISSRSSTGTGGNITLTTPSFYLNDSTVTAEARDNASGGNITVAAPEMSEGNGMRIINSRISSQSNQSGGGNISLAARSIRLEGNSDIETLVSTGDDDGGDITLSADYIVAFDDSDLFAFSGNGENRGDGGNITLNTPAFFGENYTEASLQANPDTLRNNNRVDINATGSVDGEVSTPNVRFVEDGLTDLPDNFIVSERLIASSCITRSRDGRGTLSINDSDGLAITPSSALTTPLSTGNVQAIPSDGFAEAEAQTDSLEIEEPTGIYQLADGRLVMGQACL